MSSCKVTRLWKVVKSVRSMRTKVAHMLRTPRCARRKTSMSLRRTRFSVWTPQHRLRIRTCASGAILMKG